MSDTPPSSYAARNLTERGDLLELTYESLDEPDFLNRVVDHVRRDSSGAIGLFIGTTRDEFQGDSQQGFPRPLCYHFVPCLRVFSTCVVLALYESHAPSNRKSGDAIRVPSIHASRNENALFDN